MLQIAVQYIHNNLILPIFQGSFFGAIKEYSKVCIADTHLSKYMQKYIKPIINRSNITCGCEICISYVLLQLNLNKWWLSKLAKLDKLYINFA